MLANTITVSTLTINNLSINSDHVTPPLLKKDNLVSADSLVPNRSVYHDSALPHSAVSAKETIARKPTESSRNSVRFKSSSASSPTWAGKGLLFTSSDAYSRFAPSVIDYEGSMILYYANSQGNMLWAQGSSIEGWSTTKPVDGQATGLTNGPTLAVLYEPMSVSTGGVTISDTPRRNVHVVYPTSKGLFHKRLVESVVGSDTTTMIWEDNGYFGDSSLQSTNTDYKPALIGFNNRLFCAFIGQGVANRIYFCVWTPDSTDYSKPGTWSKPILPTGLNPQPAAKDVPALYVFENNLYMVYASNSTDNLIDGQLVQVSCNYNTEDGSISLNSTYNGFSQIEQTQFGCQAVHDSSGTWLTFQGYNSTNVMVSYAPIPVAGRTPTFQSSQYFNQHTHGVPAIAISDGIANCIFRFDNLYSSQAIAYAVAGDTANWMSRIDGDTLWSQLCIPGTHDSVAISSVPYTTTQGMNIEEQLNAGIRYFDIRLSLLTDFSPPVLWVSHGPVALEKFSDICDIFNTWLGKHPSEATFMQIKQEDNSDPTQFGQALLDLLRLEPLWTISPTVEKLDVIRGKTQILVRSKIPAPDFGIYLNNWPANTTGTLYPLASPDDHTPWIVEDYYETPYPLVTDAITSKWQVVETALNGAQGHDDPKTVRIVYTSAAAKVGRSAFTAEQMATGPFWGNGGVNQKLKAYIENKYPRLNPMVLMMDFPEEPNGDMIPLIIENNWSYRAS